MFKMPNNTGGSFIGQIGYNLKGEILTFIPKLDGTLVEIYLNSEKYDMSENENFELEDLGNNMYRLDSDGIELFIFFTNLNGRWMIETDYKFDDKYFENTNGLIGTWNNNLLDDLTKRDGIVTQDENNFGESWRLNLNESYFNFTSEVDDTFEGETLIFDISKFTEEELNIAKDKCSHKQDFDFINCVMDYSLEGEEVLNTHSYSLDVCDPLCVQGICSNSTCVCYNGYKGEDCSIKILVEDDKEFYEEWWFWLSVAIFVLIVVLVLIKCCKKEEQVVEGNAAGNNV